MSHPGLLRRVPALLQLLPLLVLLLACPARPAAPREELARDLAMAVAPYKGWQLEKFRLKGLPSGLLRPLKKGLALYGRPRLGGLLGRESPMLTPALLAQDADRILLYMARHGYPWAEMSAVASPRSQRRVELVLRVEPGPVVHVSALELEGLKGSPLANREGDLRDLLPQPGQVFRDEAFLAGIRDLEKAMFDAGHARAAARGQVRQEDSLHVRLAFNAEPGPACSVDSVIVTGVKPDLARLALRSLSLVRDRPCTPRLLAGAQDRLSLLGVFRQIRFNLEDPPPGVLERGSLVLQADLAPRPPRTLEAGVGWWMAEGGRLSGRLSHANLFSGGRGLQVSGSLSRVKQIGRIESWWPALIAPSLRGEITLLLDRQREVSYRLLNRELRLGARLQPALLITLSGGLAVSEVLLDMRSPDSTAFLAEPGRQTIFSAAAVRNSTDDLLDPRRGMQTSLQAEWTIPGFFSNADYLRLETEQAVYRSLGVVTGAAHVRLGLAWPLGDSHDLLPNRRFFAGGLDQRGFGRHRLGPRDATGAFLGGAALALGSVELRVPLVWRFGLAAFLDAGQVWASPSEMRVDEVELAAGPALLLRTPVGPVRGDLGLRLGAADDHLGRWALHVSIGHPF